MSPADVYIVIEKQRLTLNDCFQRCAQQIDAKQFTEAAAEWGRAVQAASCLADLDHLMRAAIFSANERK